MAFFDCFSDIQSTSSRKSKIKLLSLKSALNLRLFFGMAKWPKTFLYWIFLHELSKNDKNFVLVSRNDLRYSRFTTWKISRPSVSLHNTITWPGLFFNDLSSLGWIVSILYNLKVCCACSVSEGTIFVQTRFNQKLKCFQSRWGWNLFCFTKEIFHPDNLSEVLKADFSRGNQRLWKNGKKRLWQRDNHRF